MSNELSLAIRMRFGQKVRELRQKNSLSQEEFAALAGVHRTYIGMVERGEKNVTLITLFRLSNALGVLPADILDGIPHGG